VGYFCFSVSLKEQDFMPSFAAHLIIAQEVFGSLKDPDIEGGKNYFLSVMSG